MIVTQIQNHAIQALKEKRFFKLVCGASFNDLQTIENLSFIFTLTGAHVIDLAPRADVILAARKGIKKALSYKLSVLSPFLMASIQLDKDPHFRKVEVNYDKCDLCGICIKICPTGAFVIDREFKYYSERCYGCNLCPKHCHVSALTMREINPTPFETTQEMISLGIDALEFHFGENYEAVSKIWTSEFKYLIKGLGLLSFSIGSELLSEKEIKEAANLCYRLAGRDIILQCDGKPMSGGFKKKGNNSDSSSITVAKIIQNENLPVYLQISGGTSECSYKAAIENSVNIHGVAIGSYARKLLMPDLQKPDLLSDKKILGNALDIATKLVSSVGKH